MPLRLLTREQTWLMPPSLDELVTKDHPARFVAAVVDAMDSSEWAALGIGIDGEPLGAPAYHPRALLGVWLYGFMNRVRSSRKLEAACRDQMPYLWLTGWQHPDHNTLWRFYQAHRDRMRSLIKRTIRMAVEMGLLNMAVQAVDGTKIVGNASKSRTYSAEGLKKLLDRTEIAIKELEAENEAGNDVPPQHLPQKLSDAKRLRDEVKAAMQRLAAEEGRTRINLTDAEIELVKSRQGIVAGYNAQAVVSPIKVPEAKKRPGRPPQRGGLFITAADVVADPTDTAHLVPMLDQAEEHTGKRADMSLADAGYHSGENLEACERHGQAITMPEAQQRALESPYHKDRFVHDVATDSYICPNGKVLPFRRVKHTKGVQVREYRASGKVCQACPAFGICTKNSICGRRLEIRPHEEALLRHRKWMATDEAKILYKRRMILPEPVFGIIKEQMGVRRFLLRGLQGVRAEWTLVAIAFNLRTLWRFRGLLGKFLSLSQSPLTETDILCPKSTRTFHVVATSTITSAMVQCFTA
jgi:transposase